MSHLCHIMPPAIRLSDQHGNFSHQPLGFLINMGTLTCAMNLVCTAHTWDWHWQVFTLKKWKMVLHPSHPELNPWYLLPLDHNWTSCPFVTVEVAKKWRKKQNPPTLKGGCYKNTSLIGMSASLLLWLLWEHITNWNECFPSTRKAFKNKTNLAKVSPAFLPVSMRKQMKAVRVVFTWKQMKAVRVVRPYLRTEQSLCCFCRTVGTATTSPRQKWSEAAYAHTQKHTLTNNSNTHDYEELKDKSKVRDDFLYDFR